jgi:Rne/Rng family ribonuclease
MGREFDNQVLVATRGVRQWVAWMKADRLVELHVQQPGIVDDMGSIHAGRVARVDRNLDVAFVEIEDGRSGMLPLDQAEGRVVEGATLIVQVARSEHSGKGARLSARPAITGSYLVLTPGRRGVSVSERIRDRPTRQRLAKAVSAMAVAGAGFMIRTAASDVEADLIESEARRLREQWQRVLDLQKEARGAKLLLRGPTPLYRLLRDSGREIIDVCFDTQFGAQQAIDWCRIDAPALASRIRYQRPQDWPISLKEILDQADAAIERHASLPSGGRLLFESGETLTAIDVDSGRHATSSGDSKSAQVFLKTNLEAAEEIGWQLRLRNIGGIIVIDFINMADPAHRRQLIDRLKAVVAGDPAGCWVGSMSRLGLVEMTRRRRGPTLAHLLTSVCAECEGTGLVRHQQGDVATEGK